MLIRPLRPLLSLVATAAVILLLIDVSLFRSGLYYAWVEPSSTAGSVVGATRSIAHEYDATRKNVLVVGNSQIGEGFSAAIADAASGRADLHFINGSVAGTGPRLWYYLLRAVDPHADRFAALAMMVDYDIASNLNDLGNYPLDSSYAVPLLRLADISDFPASFSDGVQHERARRAILFPLLALRDDAQAFIAHPLQRHHKVAKYWPEWLNAVAHYAGRDGTQPALAIDAGTGLPIEWGPGEAEIKPKLQPYFEGLRLRAEPALQASNDAYIRLWVGRIAERYAAHGVPVILFVVPRGPWRAELSPTPVLSGGLAEMSSAGRIQPLPGTAFSELEQPQFFFDTLHMNRAGRERFSRLFALAVAPLVH